MADILALIEMQAGEIAELRAKLAALLTERASVYTEGCELIAQRDALQREVESWKRLANLANIARDNWTQRAEAAEATARELAQQVTAHPGDRQGQ